MSQEQLQVVLVDDQALVRAGFAMVIDSQPDLSVTGQAGDGQEALSVIRELQPDVVLMDVRMPRLDGISATRALVEMGDAGEIRAPRIIVLTTFDTDEYALEALRAGASGFLLKDAQPEVLLDSIRTVVDGGAVIAPTTTRRLLDTVFSAQGRRAAGREAPGSAPSGGIGQDSGRSGAQTPSGAAAQAGAATQAGAAPAGAAEPPGAAAQTNTGARADAAAQPDQEQSAILASLTPRELEVLTLVAQGMSNAEIVDALVLAAPTVKTHVSRILMKLQARDRVQAVVFAYEAGLVQPGSC